MNPAAKIQHQEKQKSGFLRVEVTPTGTHDPRMKTLLITGASSGFGRHLAANALLRGHRVMMAVRNPESVSDLVESNPETAAAISFDLTAPADAALAIGETLRCFGRIDCLINNAGYGLLAALEETTDEQLARNLETNFTGPLRLIRAVLPAFREQKAGHVISISAIAAYANHSGFAVYGGAKAALDAACDAVAQETAPYGIRFTQVVPGPFRTDFIGRSLEKGEPLAAYAATVGKFGSYLEKINGTQPGDPAAAAKAIIDLLDLEKPPVRLVLGNYATTMFAKKLTAQESELAAWRDIGIATDVAPGK